MPRTPTTRALTKKIALVVMFGLILVLLAVRLGKQEHSVALSDGNSVTIHAVMAPNTNFEPPTAVDRFAQWALPMRYTPRWLLARYPGSGNYSIWMDSARRPLYVCTVTAPGVEDAQPKEAAVVLDYAHLKKYIIFFNELPSSEMLEINFYSHDSTIFPVTSPESYVTPQNLVGSITIPSAGKE